jgi:hypothetical protein
MNKYVRDTLYLILVHTDIKYNSEISYQLSVYRLKYQKGVRKQVGGTNARNKSVTCTYTRPLSA